MLRDAAWRRLLTMTGRCDRHRGMLLTTLPSEGGAYLYILRCADGSYYVGTTTGGLERRLAEHQDGTFGGYTASRRPVTLVFHQHFMRLEDAARAERQVKGWRREKKEAMIGGNFAALPALSRRAAVTTVLR